MSYLKRKMFANGGASSTIGDFEIRDKITGETLIDLSQRPDFINTPGFNPYKILYDDTLEKGPAVLSILQDFQKRDAPKLGPFQADEDVGTNIADLGFGIGRATEPVVRGLSRALGEVTGVQTLKDFGGTQEFDPTLSLSPGPVPFIDLFKPSYESYVPTDADRARAQIDILKTADVLKGQTSDLKSQARPFLEDAGRKVADYFNLGYPFGTPDYGSSITDDLKELDVVDKAVVEDVTEQAPTELPRGIVEIRNISPDDYEGSNIALLKQEMEIIGRDEEGNPLPETRLLQNPEIQDLLDEIKPIELKVDVDKTEADSLMDTELKFEGLKPGELKEGTEKIFESIRPGEDPTKPIAPIMPIGEPAPEKDAVTRKLEQPGFFGSDRFLDFIRNVGGELTRTGQFSTGLSLGASKAAEERAARELMAEQEERDFASKLRLARAEAELEAAGEGPYDKDKIKTYVEFETNLTGALKKFDEDERIVSDLNQILNEDINDPNAFGVKGFITKISEDLRAAAGMGEKEWNNLEPAKRIQTILDVTAQRSVRNILGESGKTISNLDRELVANIFGSVNVFTSPAELKKKLEDSRAQIIQGMRNAQDTITSNATALQEAGYPSRVLQNNIPLLQRILKFNFDDIENYKLGSNATGYIETTL
tara:strand:+ start:1061 stop:3019 length:1959 start_codon:yes stop_codon:yes gene_type:complete